MRHRANRLIAGVQVSSDISNSPLAKTGNSPHQPLALFMVEKEPHELDASRHAHAVENLKQVVSNDRMLARGYSSRTVALTFYTISIAAALAARLALLFGLRGLLSVLSLAVAALFGLANWLGALRGENRKIR